MLLESVRFGSWLCTKSTLQPDRARLKPLLPPYLNTQNVQNFASIKMLKNLEKLYKKGHSKLKKRILNSKISDDGPPLYDDDFIKRLPNGFGGQLKYEFLQEHQIRLLKRVKNNSNLEFQLYVADVRQKPKYAALSYVWGSDLAKQPLIVNGVEFWPTQNLFDALERLKSDEEVEAIWVDAICINQQDIPERSREVWRMKDIYQNTYSVVVWLGHPSDEEDAKLAFDLMDTLHRQFLDVLNECEVNQPSILETDIVRESHYRFSNLLMKDTPENSCLWNNESESTAYHAWRGVWKLIRAEWWSRTWVLQEATIPEETEFIQSCNRQWDSPHPRVKFIYGHHKTSWPVLTVLINVIFNLYDSQPAIHTRFTWNYFNYFRTTLDVRGLRAKQPDGVDLLSALSKFSLSNCLDPKDKLYAPLCISLPSVKKVILPDYSKSITEAYKDVAVYYLSQGSLEFLGYNDTTAKKSTGKQGWPSWLPDWQQYAILYPLPRQISFSNQYSPYYAMGKNQVRAQLNGLNLAVHGVLCDEIVDIISIGEQLSEPVSKAKEICDLTIKQWYPADPISYFTSETIASTILRTLASDINRDLSFYETGTRFADGEFALPNALDDQSTEEEIIEFERAKTNLDMNMCARSLCRTKQNFIGLVHETSLPGDKIYGFLGGNVLYTVRKPETLGKDDEFEFIGECYLHGLMDGEIMNWVEKGTVQSERLVLI
jgi:Heterokaryon incompatibility protein (HET)